VHYLGFELDISEIMFLENKAKEEVAWNVFSGAARGNIDLR
jgi:hypothetical protein